MNQKEKEIKRIEKLWSDKGLHMHCWFTDQNKIKPWDSKEKKMKAYLAYLKKYDKKIYNKYYKK